MPGGAIEAYPLVREIFEAVAAKVDDEPCVSWLGPGAAGHYVKMVHNGIEYGLMQLIAESYHVMKHGLGLDNRRLQETYRQWSRGALSGFLMEITAEIFGRQDEHTGLDLVDEILDAARQKGTGMWTTQQALALQVPTPNIDLAVMMRDLSARREERQRAAELLRTSLPTFQGDIKEAVNTLAGALNAAFILTYAQGMALLREASVTSGYGLRLATVARIWRGGCIIRAALLDDLREVYLSAPELDNPLLAPSLASRLLQQQNQLRRTVVLAAQLGIPTAGLMGALAYFDSYRSSRLPTNLIQAQRDYFGAHTYERVDSPGTFHTEWQRS
jgi:6-phosphogluconate dehydrogenase